MSAELLRWASSAISAHHSPWHMDVTCGHPSCERDRFMNAVADWLASAANQHPDEDGCYQFEPPAGCYEARHALNVARAYLGEPS